MHETLAIRLREKYKLNIFIETGTYSGFSSLWAAHHGFIVHTIELSKDRWEGLETAFHSEHNIHFYRGDSKDILPTILEKVEEPALIFLDAHYGQDRGGGMPLMGEIEAIKNCPLRHIVMVDDARLFGVGRDWPTKEQVIKALEDSGRVSYEFEDVIVGEYD